MRLRNMTRTAAAENETIHIYLSSYAQLMIREKHQSAGNDRMSYAYPRSGNLEVGHEAPASYLIVNLRASLECKMRRK